MVRTVSSSIKRSADGSDTPFLKKKSSKEVLCATSTGQGKDLDLQSECPSKAIRTGSTACLGHDTAAAPHDMPLTIPDTQRRRLRALVLVTMFTISTLALFFLSPAALATPTFGIFAVNGTGPSGTEANGTIFNSTTPLPVNVTSPLPVNVTSPLPVNVTSPLPVNSTAPLPITSTVPITNSTSPLNTTSPITNSTAPGPATSATSSWNYTSPFYNYPLNTSEPDNTAYISPKWQEAHEKARSALASWTLEEKVDLTTGVYWQRGRCVGNTPPIPNQDFPGLCLQDSPLGVRFADYVSAFPAGINVAST